jgi:hypothetical protein
MLEIAKVGKQHQFLRYVYLLTFHTEKYAARCTNGRSDGLRRSIVSVREWPVWAVLVARPKRSDFDGFSNNQSVFKFDTQVSDGAVHLCMPQQELNGAQVACLLVNLGDLRAPH